MTEHLPALNVQGDVANVPVPLVVQLTVPVGVIGVPAAPVSATVAVHVVTLLTTMLAGAQTTVVLVGLGLTVIVPDVPVLMLWFVSPP